MERKEMTLQVRENGKWDLLHAELKLSLNDCLEKRKKDYTDGGKAIPFHHSLGFTELFLNLIWKFQNTNRLTVFRNKMLKG